MYPEPQDIFLKGPYYYGETREYRIIQKHSPKPHILITSPMVVLSNYCLVRNYLKVNIDHLHSNPQCLKMVKFLTELEADIQENSQIMEGKSFISAIQTWNNNKFLRLSCDAQEMTCYDLDKKQIRLEQIKKGSLIKVMFWVKGVQVTRKYVSLKIIILQIRMFDVLPPKQCVILSDEKIDHPTLGFPESCLGAKKETRENSHQNTIPEKYRKMLAMGIPMASVTQRCIMDGQDPSILSTPTGNSIDQNHKPELKLARPPMANLLSGLGNVKLNKVKIHDQRQKPMVRVKKPKNIHVPTLDDILSMKNKLKSVKRTEMD